MGHIRVTIEATLLVDTEAWVRLYDNHEYDGTRNDEIRVAVQSLLNVEDAIPRWARDAIQVES